MDRSKSERGSIVSWPVSRTIACDHLHESPLCPTDRMPTPRDPIHPTHRLVGRAVERVEDAALLTGHGCFADDMGERPGTAHAAVLRSPHAHAEIVSFDAEGSGSAALRSRSSHGAEARRRQIARRYVEMPSRTLAWTRSMRLAAAGPGNRRASKMADSERPSKPPWLQSIQPQPARSTTSGFTC